MKTIYCKAKCPIENRELLIQYEIILMIYTISEFRIFTAGTKTTVSAWLDNPSSKELTL